MSRQRAGKTEYKVYYGVDSNAALQPQYVPKKKERHEEDRKQSVSRAREAKALRRAEVAKCAAMTMLVICVAALGFLVVTRNAQIYSNNRTIRGLANEKTDLQIMINTAEKDGSVEGGLDTYFAIAENQLALQYPTEENIVTVVLPSSTDEVSAEVTQEDANVYDAVLDWFSSLQRRIESWA